MQIDVLEINGFGSNLLNGRGKKFFNAIRKAEIILGSPDLISYVRKTCSRMDSPFDQSTIKRVTHIVNFKNFAINVSLHWFEAMCGWDNDFLSITKRKFDWASEASLTSYIIEHCLEQTNIFEEDEIKEIKKWSYLKCIREGS